MDKIVKFDEMSSEMQKDVLDLIAMEHNDMNDTDIYTAQSPFIKEVAADLDYEIIGTGISDWVFA